VKLRFVNATAMTYYDVRIPGLKMTVVASDGRDVQPVVVDEFRIAVAEAYDVIVEPEAGKAYTIFAESIDRSGYAAATLAPRAGMIAPIPARRPRALLTLAEMGHNTMPGMNHAAMGHGPASPSPDHSEHDHAAMGHGAASASPDHSKHDHATMDHSPANASSGHSQHDHAIVQRGTASVLPKVDHGMGREVQMAGMDHSTMNHGEGLGQEGDFDGSGRVFGWASGAPHGARVLSYADLRSAEPQKDTRPPTREIVIRLTGNMERYIWTMDGKRFGEAEPFRMTYGDRVRVTFVNETMMAHPMHLHGMFMQAETAPTPRACPTRPCWPSPRARPPPRSSPPTRRASGPSTATCSTTWRAGMMQKLVVATSDGPAGPAADPHAGHGSHH
jgi:FtsP/CotA-like multicopper oxidase with cupredoxin domain